MDIFAIQEDESALSSRVSEIKYPPTTIAMSSDFGANFRGKLLAIQEHPGTGQFVTKMKVDAGKSATLFILVNFEFLSFNAKEKNMNWVAPNKLVIGPVPWQPEIGKAKPAYVPTAAHLARCAAWAPITRTILDNSIIAVRGEKHQAVAVGDLVEVRGYRIAPTCPKDKDKPMKDAGVWANVSDIVTVTEANPPIDDYNWQEFLRNEYENMRDTALHIYSGKDVNPDHPPQSSFFLVPLKKTKVHESILPTPVARSAEDGEEADDSAMDAFSTLPEGFELTYTQIDDAFFGPTGKETGDALIKKVEGKSKTFLIMEANINARTSILGEKNIIHAASAKVDLYTAQAGMFGAFSKTAIQDLMQFGPGVTDIMVLVERDDAKTSAMPANSNDVKVTKKFAVTGTATMVATNFARVLQNGVGIPVDQDTATWAHENSENMSWKIKDETTEEAKEFRKTPNVYISDWYTCCNEKEDVEFKRTYYLVMEPVSQARVLREMAKQVPNDIEIEEKPYNKNTPRNAFTVKIKRFELTKAYSDALIGFLSDARSEIRCMIHIYSR